MKSESLPFLTWKSSPVMNIRIIMLPGLRMNGSDVNLSIINKVFCLEQKFRGERELRGIAKQKTII